MKWAHSSRFVLFYFGIHKWQIDYLYSVGSEYGKNDKESKIASLLNMQKELVSLNVRKEEVILYAFFFGINEINNNIIIK